MSWKAVFENPLDPKGRHADLLRQGFMKPSRQRKQRVKRPIVACEKCLDWHEEGRHIRKKAPATNPREPKDPATMTGPEINRELDRLDRLRSGVNEELIAAGRGRETARETDKKTDPLALKWRALADRQQALRIEIELRYGPGAPSRLPRGFGPRRRP